MDQITVVVLGGAQEPALKRLSQLGPDVRLKHADKASDLAPELAAAGRAPRSPLRPHRASRPERAVAHGFLPGQEAARRSRGHRRVAVRARCDRLSSPATPTR